jgi:hypothetical protein
MVGKYVVARRPLQGSVHTLYMIMDGHDICGTSISHPGEADCASAIERNRMKSAASMTKVAIAAAKKRKPRALRIKEAA